MAVLLHIWEFKNMELKFLEVRETIWLPGLPDIRILKFWDFLNSTVSASTAGIQQKHLTEALQKITHSIC